LEVAVKQRHRPDLWCWSHFDEARNVDFHGIAWMPEGGPAVVIDPLPISAHDRAHLESMGTPEVVVVSNSDHVRAARELSELWGARLLGPAAEKDAVEGPFAGWLSEGDTVTPGLSVFALEGSKTPGELAFLLEDTTLICGDLVRGQAGGRLNVLPDAKLADKAQAVQSVRRLAKLAGIDAVIVGDGWHVFRDGGRALEELAASL
jgi:hypothetical protein